MDDTLMIVRNKKGSMVGTIDNKIFLKEVYGHKHMLRKPISWAIDCDIFDSVISPNCFTIHIVDKDTGHRYICGVKKFSEYKQKINRKFGDQYYLELNHWIVQ